MGCRACNVQLAACNLHTACVPYSRVCQAGERLASVIAEEQTGKSGIYWSWNGDAKYMGVGNAGGSGGEIFENEFSGMVRDERLGELAWDYSMDAVKPFL